MKRLLIISALAAIALASCARTESVMSNDDAVSFGVYTTQTTRGTVADITTMQAATDEGFGVWGFYTKQSPWLATSTEVLPNFMWNQQVKYQDNAWFYTPLKYWPNTLGDKISFFAYAPYSNQGTTVHTTPEDCYNWIMNNTANPTGIDLKPNYLTGWPDMFFAIDPSPAAMEDLLYADNLTDQVKRTDAMKFTFNHALTRVNLVARLDKELTNIVATYGNSYVFVTDVKIVGTGDCARYPEGATAAGNPESRFFQTGKLIYGQSNVEGVADADKTRWDYAPTHNATDGTPTDATEWFAKRYAAPYEMTSILALHANGSTPNQPEDYMTIKIKSASEFTGDAAADPVTPLFKANEYLFLIPPYNYEGIKAETDVVLQIGYDIVTADANLQAGWSRTHTDARISLPNGTLKMGSAYRYTLTIGLEDIKIDAEVTPWGDENKFYAPSVTLGEGETTAELLARLNAAKVVDPDCNYFVANIGETAIPTQSIANGAVAAYLPAFVAGDIVEFKFDEAVSFAILNMDNELEISLNGGTSWIKCGLTPVVVNNSTLVLAKRCTLPADANPAIAVVDGGLSGIVQSFALLDVVKAAHPAYTTFEINVVEQATENIKYFSNYTALFADFHYASGDIVKVNYLQGCRHINAASGSFPQIKVNEGATGVAWQVSSDQTTWANVLNLTNTDDPVTFYFKKD